VVDHAAHGGPDLSPGPGPGPGPDPGPDPGGAGPDDIDHEERLEAGRLLFAAPCVFVAGVAERGALPPPGLPEVAFAGRSNVGKSSLINALTGRRALARTSNTPGRTQQINLFELGGRLVLADLPGYGYAKAPKQRVAAWNRLIEDYLRGRPSLRRVCLLIDARHGIKDTDRPVMRLLAEAAVPYGVVLTKADAVGARALEDLREGLEADLRREPGADPRVLAASARTGAGIERLRSALAALAEPAATERRRVGA
jgi:GTP-binding protein